jgi:SAM-dependent methyltransferase
MKPPRDASALIQRSAARLYGKISSNWPQNDQWNEYKHQETQRFILRTGSAILLSAKRALDAGAGDSVYEWMPQNCVSLDRHHKQLSQKNNAIVGDVERMPFSDDCFDLIICIGSVLNYVSAAEALNEFARVTSSGGCIFLHFETSTSFEHLFKSAWGSSVHPNKTTNASRTDFVWVYSPKYILSLLTALRFNVIKIARFHVISALLCRLGVQQRHAHHFARLDRMAPFLKYFSDDVVILAQKT